MIRNVVFDVGGVLVRLRYQPFVEYLAAAGVDMFDRPHEMFELASGLMADYRVYLLSNVGDLHWRHLDAQYGLDDLVHGTLASFRVGAIKPSEAIYREAELRFGLEPAATVFIDDLVPNVAGARARGWQAIHHVDPAETRRQLRSLRIGYTAMTLPQLKIVQEVVTLTVFVPFVVFYMRQPLKLDYLWAGLCMLGAVYSIFRK